MLLNWLGDLNGICNEKHEILVSLGCEYRPCKSQEKNGSWLLALRIAPPSQIGFKICRQLAAGKSNLNRRIFPFDEDAGSVDVTQAWFPRTTPIREQ
jgi:hypothetical protein